MSSKLEKVSKKYVQRMSNNLFWHFPKLLVAKGIENSDGKRGRNWKDSAGKKKARGRGDDHEETYGKGQKAHKTLRVTMNHYMILPSNL